MKAILSDIHGNLEALTAVLDDLRRHPVEAVYCLGDVVGYGPDPRACLDLAMTWPVCLRGNHEQAIMAGPNGFNPEAERALLWTSGQIHAPVPTAEAADRRLAFLTGLPQQHRDGGLLFVHASPREPLGEYVFPEDVADPDLMHALFERVDHCCFMGHTHVPGIFTESLEFLAPWGDCCVYRLGGDKVLVNVGSVGQPRDGDWRACYVLLDGDMVIFRRVEYDIEKTAAKIHATPDLPPRLGDRLFRGE
jgi:diadenosine tetraphosphatase ApaH/serine/threonine PP2A family protein phosphatase